MLERWILASLVIGLLIGGRVLLRRFIVPLDSRGCDSADDRCLTSGCKTLRSTMSPPRAKQE